MLQADGAQRRTGARRLRQSLNVIELLAAAVGVEDQHLRVVPVGGASDTRGS
jgi:hypothetical protein